MGRPDLLAPFPWFGGKRRAAALVWAAVGDVRNYVEPFAGSAAVLLARPVPEDAGRLRETINDADGLLANFWRALRADPAAVAHHADWPVNENDLHARHAWLVGQRESLTARLEGDPDWYDVKAAGWWVWGCCAWIGSGWCSGRGPWGVAEDADGNKVLTHLGNAGRGVNRQLPHLGDAGRGVNRKLPHLGDAGRGVNRQLPHLGDAGSHGNGIHGVVRGPLADYMDSLAARLRYVRVACGDWSRVTGPSVTWRHGLTGVFLDPPYGEDSGRGDAVYARDPGDVAAQARAWAIENGDNPLLRIVLAGYEGEHDMPKGWTTVGWKADGGYGSQGNGAGRENAARETLWLSPHCLRGGTAHAPVALVDDRQAALF